MYIIGITGPSGAGKTTALKVLEAMGGQVFDCDAVYHEMLETDGELLGRIEAAFPGAVKDYVLDRKVLGARVFADPAGLQRLTDITQPLVKRHVMRSIETSESELIIIDAIGLFESGLGAECDLTVAVTADEEVRLQRLTARDGITEAYARARIAAQKPAEWFTCQADLTLENNGTEEDFARTCRRVFAAAMGTALPGRAPSGSPDAEKQELP